MRLMVSTICVSLLGSTAISDIFEFDNSVSNEWSNPSNWTNLNGSDPGPPNAGDRAVIPDGESVVIDATDSITIDTVEVEENGQILIETDGSLTLQNHNCGLVPTCGAYNSILDGKIVLETEATLAFTTRDHTITGDVSTGESLIESLVDNDTDADGGQITVAASIFLKNSDVGIQGALTISGSGTLINDGFVEAVNNDPGIANVEDTLFVNIDIVEDTVNDDEEEPARWITNCQATLYFKNQACLLGDFDDIGIITGNGGEFSFDDIVHTLGTYFRLGCGDVSYGINGEFAASAQVHNMCALTTTSTSTSCDDNDLDAFPSETNGTDCVAGS